MIWWLMLAAAALALSACSGGAPDTSGCVAARVAIAAIPPGTLAYSLAEDDLRVICGVEDAA